MRQHLLHIRRTPGHRRVKSLFDARAFEQIVDEARQLSGLARDDAGHAVDARAAGLALQERGGRHDRRERITQFMRQHVQKTGAALMHELHMVFETPLLADVGHGAQHACAGAVGVEHRPCMDHHAALAPIGGIGEQFGGRLGKARARRQRRRRCRLVERAAICPVQCGEAAPAANLVRIGPGAPQPPGGAVGVPYGPIQRTTIRRTSDLPDQQAMGIQRRLAAPVRRAPPFRYSCHVCSLYHRIAS